MAVKTFTDFLKEKVGEQDAARREEWVVAVERLIAQLRSWIQESDPEGLLAVSQGTLDRQEEGLGYYQAPGLSIRLGASKVTVAPIGRNIVGFVGPRGDDFVRADGRVDITDGAKKYKLYRTLKGGEQWHVLDDRHEPTPLDRNRFEAILQDLLA